MSHEELHQDAFCEGDPPRFGNAMDRADTQRDETTALVGPVGRARRITGITLLVFGAAIVLRMLWLCAFYHEAFGEIEWVRFIGLLVIGSWLSLAGGWLAFRSKIAWIALLVSFAALLVAGLVYEFLLWPRARW